jgi:hypothetical protein
LPATLGPPNTSSAHHPPRCSCSLRDTCSLEWVAESTPVALLVVQVAKTTDPQRQASVQNSSPIDLGRVCTSSIQAVMLAQLQVGDTQVRHRTLKLAGSAPSHSCREVLLATSGLSPLFPSLHPAWQHTLCPTFRYVPSSSYFEGDVEGRCPPTSTELLALKHRGRRLTQW